MQCCKKSSFLIIIWSLDNSEESCKSCIHSYTHKKIIIQADTSSFCARKFRKTKIVILFDSSVNFLFRFPSLNICYSIKTCVTRCVTKIFLFSFTVNNSNSEACCIFKTYIEVLSQESSPSCI